MKSQRLIRPESAKFMRLSVIYHLSNIYYICSWYTIVKAKKYQIYHSTVNWDTKCVQKMSKKSFLVTARNQNSDLPWFLDDLMMILMIFRYRVFPKLFLLIRITKRRILLTRCLRQTLNPCMIINNIVYWITSQTKMTARLRSFPAS